MPRSRCAVADEVPALGPHEHHVRLDVVAVGEEHVDGRGEEDPEGMFVDERAEDPHEVRDDYLMGPAGTGRADGRMGRYLALLRGAEGAPRLPRRTP